MCRDHNISAGTFYKWKAKFGGLQVSEAQKLRKLEAENVKLKRIVAGQALDNLVLKDLLSKNWQGPPPSAKLCALIFPGLSGEWHCEVLLFSIFRSYAFGERLGV